MPRLRLAAFLGQYGLTPRIKWSCTNLHTVVQAVKEGMAKKMAEDPDAMYYSRDDEDDFNDDFAFQTIEPDQSFYLNEQGQVVIVFPKYAIAPGYMGIQEFTVSGVRTA